MSANISFATRLVRWLTLRRLTAQAWILLVCLWPVAIIDFLTSGVMDRAGNVKFQDFVQFYVGGTLVRSGQIAYLYDWRTALAMMHEIAPQWKFGLPMVYGPQVEALFAPLSHFSFLAAAAIWVAISMAIYLACCYLLWRSCPVLAPYSTLFWLLVLAYPALFHYVIRGQISPLMLLCFTAAWFAFRAERPLLAGICLGSLAFKPQLLVAIPIVFLLARAWKPLLGTVIGAAGQLALTSVWCGTEVMRQYVSTLANLSRLVAATETTKAHAQMHSLRSFFSLLVPWPNVALGFTLITAAIIMVLAARMWRSDLPLPARFSTLIVAAVLVNPHLFVYDLLVLVPALILLADWIYSERAPQPPVRDVLACCLYGAYLLPLLGPLTMITHLQLSVLALVWLQWELWRASKVRVPCLSV